MIRSKKMLIDHKCLFYSDANNVNEIPIGSIVVASNDLKDLRYNLDKACFNEDLCLTKLEGYKDGQFICNGKGYDFIYLISKPKKKMPKDAQGRFEKLVNSIYGEDWEKQKFNKTDVQFFFVRAVKTENTKVLSNYEMERCLDEYFMKNCFSKGFGGFKALDLKRAYKAGKEL